MPQARRWLVLLRGTILWRLPWRPEWEIPLAGFPRWSLLGPSGYELIHPSISRPGRLFQVAPDEYLFETSGIALVDRTEVDRAGTVQTSESVSKVAMAVLRRLRFLSCQFNMARELDALVGPGNHTPILRMIANAAEPTDSIRIRGRIQAHRLSTAVDERHINILAGLPPDFEEPIHAVTMLDALKAFEDNDFRSAILYAAMAIEILAGETLDRAYAALRSGPSLSSHRVVAVRQAGGTISKDPVYDALSRNESFPTLLHERPLYLLGRSLLVDAPDVYRKALVLYCTRNKIAHTGVAPPEEKYLSVDREGAREGLEAATRAMHWYGDTTTYPIPTDLVPVPFPEEPGA